VLCPAWLSSHLLYIYYLFWLNVLLYVDYLIWLNVHIMYVDYLIWLNVLIMYVDYLIWLNIIILYVDYLIEYPYATRWTHLTNLNLPQNPTPLIFQVKITLTQPKTTQDNTKPNINLKTKIPTQLETEWSKIQDNQKTLSQPKYKII
jgi:hypothetical protein